MNCGVVVARAWDGGLVGNGLGEVRLARRAARIGLPLWRGKLYQGKWLLQSKNSRIELWNMSKCMRGLHEGVLELGSSFMLHIRCIDGISSMASSETWLLLSNHAFLYVRESLR